MTSPLVVSALIVAGLAPDGDRSASWRKGYPAPEYRGRVPDSPLRRRLPAADRTRLELRTGDRVLVAVGLADGRQAVATRLALHVLSPDSVTRTPWADVDSGTLDPATRTLAVRWVWGASTRLTFAEDRASVRFNQAFRERVQQSVVHTTSVALPGGRRARVALRRDEDGELFSQVLADADVDLADPEVAALVDAAEDAVRDAAGLPR
ncbi:hypothetical protein [Cellulomonas edaphi]|uniref:Uncharacterized protein n=1 Tax=Cellulomonas edaphi TaxID=3053468 RepID=A0ABT7S7A2_9CELL|nr:hypothetical protein [Cellulomons edaphi]MDM7831508.1 hypothetical protein [Cellulomons edaphi]